MDPYLEGYLWPDVHQALAYQFRRQLAPLVEPEYAVRLAVSVVYDRAPAHELGIFYPDIEIVRPHQPIAPLPDNPVAVIIPPAPLSLPLALPVPVRLVTVQIHDIARNTLVSSIEILSPVNKREPGLSQFLNKRDELQAAAVHMLEIDLLRRGNRLWPEEDLPPTPYLAALIRAGHIQAEIWPITLRDQLPILPVPLRAPHPDVPLDLQAALDTIYDEARYGLTINYQEPPPDPRLEPADAEWVAARVRRSSNL
jgi:hypothetical protein